MNPTDQTLLERTGAVLECSLVPWDSEVFEFPVAQIGRVELGEDAQPMEILDAFEAWCASRDVRLVSCRLDHVQLRESAALEERGFRFIEMVYGPRFDAFDGIAAPRHVIHVAEATSDGHRIDRGGRPNLVHDGALPA